MKKLNQALAALMVVSVIASPMAFAETVNKVVDTSAKVDGALTMNVLLFKNDITGTNITAGNKMDWGTLVDIGTGTLRSSATGDTGTGAVLAYITVNSHSRPWTLKQTGTDMTKVGGTEKLEVGSLAVAPVYIASDNGGVTDGTLGTKGTFVAADKTLFTSAANGSIRTIRAYYSITDDPAGGGAAPNIPLGKLAGTYDGTVTFTATA